MRRLDAAAWSATLEPVTVVRMGAPCALTISHDALAAGQALTWQVALEDGARHSGVVRLDVEPDVSATDVDGRRRIRQRLTLPVQLPMGYHAVSVQGGGVEPACAVLIVVPERCYAPPALARGERRWGVAAQLYTLRSAQDWGMGDFGDLRRLVAKAAATGADFIGLNPLHALYPARPAHSSPYAPSSRCFLNVLYIDVGVVAEYAEAPAARAQAESAGYAQRLAQLRAADRVDYAGVAALKLPVLRELYAVFRARSRDAQSARARAYADFAAAAGAALRVQALFDCLCAHFEGRGWPAWPEGYRAPDAPAVRAFATAHADEVEFYCYLQWLADEQLAAAQAEARAQGMLLGLYRDLAVGVDAAGADAWAAQQLYRTQAAVGAPPDALALQGQDWGLPALDPNVLTARAYADFARLLRANMRHCGALRIDHVMALSRLWWVPRGLPADAGAYVAYPCTDLLGILALESQRNQCVVIGEDLGTVPEQLRTALPAARVYSYRVLYFEKAEDGRFKAPAEYAPMALAAVTTHDLPTLLSYWEGGDLRLRDRLGLFPSAEVRARSYSERAADRKALLRALADERLLPHEQDPDSAAYTQMSAELAIAIHVYLARCACVLMSVQLEDLLQIREPVNVPGTSTEYPNWQRKLSCELDALYAQPRALALFRRLDAERRGGRAR